MKRHYEEVSRTAGVSLATVYRVMNGRARARPETQAKVREAAVRLGLSARSHPKTKLLGFLLGNRTLLHPFHSRILAGAEAQCIRCDYNIIVISLNYSHNVNWKQLDLPRLLQLRDVVDGFILTGDNSQNLLDYLTHRGLPFSVQGNCVRDPWRSDKYDTVYFDDIEGAKQMTRHLQTLGHRDIWFVGNRDLASFERTYRGYEQAMLAAGLTARSEGFDTEQPREAGYLATLSILSRDEPVTAIFAGSDPTAVGVYSALRDRGRRVPEDISVVGFDDIEAKQLLPPLTTSHIFLQEIGQKLAELALNRVETPGLPPQQIAIPTRIVRRESCHRLIPQVEMNPERVSIPLA